MKRNLMFKILLTLIVGCFLSIDAFAQQMTVKGLVKDTTGEPIIGANVVVKGTTNGTITDFDGNFLLNANKGDIIFISFITKPLFFPSGFMAVTEPVRSFFLATP